MHVGTLVFVSAAVFQLKCVVPRLCCKSLACLQEAMLVWMWFLLVCAQAAWGPPKWSNGWWWRLEQERHWWARCDQNGRLLFPEEYEWLLGPGGDPHPPVAPPSAWYGSWGGGMPQWQWPAWGYVPDTPPVPAQPPVAGNSLPARGQPPVAGYSWPARGQPPVAGNSLPAGSQPPVAGNSLPARGISTKRTQGALQEEDEDQGDPSASSSGGDQDMQCLSELAWLLERSSRYDHRGYRASIRRQLRRYLTTRSMPLPDWLEDKGARFTVMQFRDASFDYIQSVKEEEKKRRQERVPPVPENGKGPATDADASLPGGGKSATIQQVCQNLNTLQVELTCRDSMPLPPVSGTSTPAATDVPMEEASDTESSLSLEVDPRQTVSERPLSPRPFPPDQIAEDSLPAGGTPETAASTAGNSLPAGGTPETAASTAEASLPAGCTPETGASTAEASLPAVGISETGASTAEGIPETGASTAESSLPAGGTEAEAPQMDGSWLLENAHARDDMSDMETVQSFEIVEEPEV